jgi:hypothetical protein
LTALGVKNVQIINERSSYRYCFLNDNLLNTNDNMKMNWAVIYLGPIKSAKAIKPLVKTAGRRINYSTSITNALKKYQNPDMTEILIGYLMDEDMLVKKGAIILLGEFREKKAIESLKHFLDDKDPDIRSLAKDSISKIESTAAPAPRIMNAPRPMSIIR